LEWCWVHSRKGRNYRCFHVGLQAMLLQALLRQRQQRGHLREDRRPQVGPHKSLRQLRPTPRQHLLERPGPALRLRGRRLRLRRRRRHQGCGRRQLRLRLVLRRRHDRSGQQLRKGGRSLTAARGDRGYYSWEAPISSPMKFTLPVIDMATRREVSSHYLAFPPASPSVFCTGPYSG
jgi:hypothetical protein